MGRPSQSHQDRWSLGNKETVERAMKSQSGSSFSFCREFLPDTKISEPGSISPTLSSPKLVLVNVSPQQQKGQLGQKMVPDSDCRCCWQQAKVPCPQCCHFGFRFHFTSRVKGSSPSPPLGELGTFQKMAHPSLNNRNSLLRVFSALDTLGLFLTEGTSEYDWLD